jgi:DNA-binding GntR family transcriptional regulator
MTQFTSNQVDVVISSKDKKTVITQPVSTLPILADSAELSLPEQGPAATQSTRERIRLALLKRISDGTYQPGERLKELAIAQEFNVSQAPVREAFRELQSMGVLVSEHYRGTRVRNLTLEETRDIYHLRGYLEEIAAQLIPLPALHREIHTIEAHQVTMRAASQAGDLEGFANTNILFHRAIVGLASNQAILRTWDSLEIGLCTRLNVHRNSKNIYKLAEVHQPIVDALRSEDLILAGRLLREHSFSFSVEVH